VARGSRRSSQQAAWLSRRQHPLRRLTTGRVRPRRAAAGHPDAAYKLLTGDDKETARYFRQTQQGRTRGQGDFDFARGGGRLPSGAPLADEGAGAARHAEDSPEEIAAKRRRFAPGRADPKSWALQIAADLTPRVPGAENRRWAANRNTVTIRPRACLGRARRAQRLRPAGRPAQDLAGQAHVFHWPLEFPDVMAAGGFDIVLGNPPWEVIAAWRGGVFCLQDCLRSPSWQAPGARCHSPALKASGQQSYEYQRRSGLRTGNEFSRASGRRSTARGKVNTYATVAELFRRSHRPRAEPGVIIPTALHRTPRQPLSSRACF